MPQRSFDFPSDITGAAAEAQLELVLRALASHSSGNSEPPETQPGMAWLDTSTSPPVLKMRNVPDTGWINLLEFVNSTTLRLVSSSISGYTLRGAPVYITSSTTYTPDDEVESIYVEAVGGGAGTRVVTAGSSSMTAAAGGGAGGYCARWFDPAESLTISVGAGGSADNAGSSTTVTHGGGQMIAGGGQLGAARGVSSGDSVAWASGGEGGTSSGGDINITGGAGDSAAAGGSNLNGVGGAGGSSFLGSGPPAVANLASIDGISTTEIGAGATGDVVSNGTKPGRSGGDGVVRIWEFV